jgi:adenine phosphoribosyltransferase
MASPLKAIALIRTIPDFPEPGILFKDITPALNDPSAFQEIIATLSASARTLDISTVVAIEARGFIVGSPIAHALGVGFVPFRKVGKLPFTTVQESYALEYGTAAVEAHVDAIQPGQRVAIVDDLLATGGTAAAAAALVERLGGVVAGFVFLVELSFLDGRARLGDRPVLAPIRY